MAQSYNSMDKMHKANKAAENDLGLNAKKREIGKSIIKGAKDAGNMIGNPMGTMADKAREYLAGKKKSVSKKEPYVPQYQRDEANMKAKKQYKNNREKTNADYESMYKKVGIANKNKSTMDKIKKQSGIDKNDNRSTITKLQDLDYERDM